MKMKYLHRLLFAAAAAVALVSCNKEQDKSASELDSDSPKNYMGFTIAMPSATKAENTGGTGTYVVGEDYENAIKTIHFYFYRKGAYVSWGYGDVAKQFKPNAGSGNVEEKLDNISEAGKGVVVLESTMAIPDQVLCVINSRNSGWYRNKSLETVLNAIHSGTAESLTGNVTDSYKDFAFIDECMAQKREPLIHRRLSMFPISLLRRLNPVPVSSPPTPTSRTIVKMQWTSPWRFT